ncbi:MAG: HU family DNA-binding protein [Prevotella sp.]|nr:HU family DNA-binding protein [Prevotella sp.]
MSVLYRLYQNTNEKSSAHNKWYARSVMTNVVDTEKLAEIMQRNCTVKRSDIKAVIEELIETMRDQLQDSKRVKLDGLGSFKLGLSSKGAEKASDFDARHHIRGVHVVFTPETTTDSTGRRSKTFLEGVTVAELPKNMVVTDGSEEGGEG